MRTTTLWDLNLLDTGIVLSVIWNILSGTPWWVYGLFGYLLYVGIKALKDHSLSLPKLFISPLLVNILAFFNNDASSTHPMTYKVGIWIVCFLVGALVSWLFSRHAPLQFNKEKLLISFPGTGAILLIGIGIFVVRYFWGAMEAIHTQPWNPLLHYLRTASLSLLSGFITGRPLYYLYRFFKAT
jgi:teichoic acid transport system permease protein